MSAAPNTQPRTNGRTQIQFPHNQPVTVALKFASPKQFGERFMFSTCDNRIFYASPQLAAQITQSGINVAQPFTITRIQDGWNVARITSVGEQADGTFAVPKLPPASADRATSDAPVERKPPVMARTLVDEANMLVDAYAEVLARGLKKYEGKVKPDEIRALTISAYIQRGKLSSVA